MRWRAKLSTSRPEPGVVEAFVLQRRRQRAQAGLLLAHGDGAHHRAEHQPVRRSILVRPRGPGEAPAADQPAIDMDGIGPGEGDGPLGRRVRERARPAAPPGRRRTPGARCAAVPRARARRRTRRGRSGRHAPACRPLPRPRSALAWAKASPTSLSVTRRKGGGRSRAGACGLAAVHLVRGTDLPDWRFLLRIDYNLRRSPGKTGPTWRPRAPEQGNSRQNGRTPRRTS